MCQCALWEQVLTDGRVACGCQASIVLHVRSSAVVVVSVGGGFDEHRVHIVGVWWVCCLGCGMWDVASSLVIVLVVRRGQTLGGTAIGIGVAFFVGSMVITALLSIPVARATYRVNEGEGYFRFRHARLKEFAECGM